MLINRRKLKDSQKIVLKSIAVDGEANINNIHKKIKLNYQRTRRATKRLTELYLLWLSEIDKNLGPKASQYYSITPYGIVEAFIDLTTFEETTKMIKNFEPYTPHYVLNFREFKRKGILKELKIILNDLYPSIVKPWGEEKYQRKPTSTNTRDCIIQSHILDTTLFFQIFEWREREISDEFKRQFLEIVIQDSEFKENWERWLSIKKFLLSSLEGLYNDLKKDYDSI